MDNARKILTGTILLTAASFLMQTVGVSFNVWLTARLGESGLGLFQLILTVYNLAVTLGCGGVRLAATRLAVEGEARHESTRRTVYRCIRYALVTGLLAAFALFSLADIAANYWLSDPNAALPLRILAMSLPFVAMSSALNGYFTAVQKVGRYSAVRIAEQAVKIGIVMAFMGRLLPKGIRYGCVAIVIGVLCSELFSFLCLFILYNIEKEKYRDNPQKFSLRDLLHISVPDVSGAGARSVLLTIEHLLIPRGFRACGVSAEQALSVYGNIHGMVFPILLYPSAILSSLAGLLIPEIAGQYAKGLNDRIVYIVRQVLRLTLLFALGTAGILYVFADGLSQVVYHDSDCVFYMRVLSPLIPVMYCDMTVDGMLKGLDQQRACMRYNILDSAVCVVLVCVLLPRFAVKGYVFILFLSEILNFYLSIRRLTKVTTVEIDLSGELFMPLGCGICAPVCVHLTLSLTGLSAMWSKGVLVFGIAAAAAGYFLMLYGFGCFEKKDAEQFLRIAGLNRLKNNTCKMRKNLV